MPDLTNIAEFAPKQSSSDVAQTEDAIALAFVRAHGDRFRYAPSMGWLHWDGTRWQRDDKLRHFDIIRAICRVRGEVAESNTENRRLESARVVAAVATLARSDQRIVHTLGEFDANALELNTPAGIVNLADGKMRPHARDLVTKCTAVAPDFAAPREGWHTFLREVFAADVETIDFVRRLLGYFLTGSTSEQVLAFCHGDGANGKSTLLDLLLWIMGDYALKLPSDTLMAKRGERHPTDIAQLQGTRCAVSNEIDEGEYWAESKLKELTGDELLTGRYMRQDFFTFRATHKHIIAGNHRPQVRAMDDAMRRRILLIPFRVKFEGDRRDRELPAKLKADAPAILADLIEAAAEWHRHGLMVPAVVHAASAEYASAMDSLALWLADCCRLDTDAECLAGTLYGSYADWKRARGEQPVSLTRWAEQMGSKGHEKYRNNGTRYRGIDLTTDARHRFETGRNP